MHRTPLFLAIGAFMRHGYGDPKKEMLGNGRSMADLMRGGGLSGVIVAPATAGGVPVNFDPDGYKRTPIHIDPDNPDGPTLTLEDMTEERVQRALKIAHDLVPGSDIHSVRERAMVTMREVAKMTAAPPPNKVNVVPEATVPQPAQFDTDTQLPDIGVRVPTNYAAMPEQVDRNYSPMAAFGLRRQNEAAKPVGPPVNSLQAGVKIGPPQRLAYFEKEGIGTVPAFFHEVLVSVSRQDPDNPEQSGFMVLIYDLRFEQNAARWFPPSDDPYGRPWAIHIKEDRRLYLVHTTGFQYVYDNREYCVLMVERAVAAPALEPAGDL